MYLVVRSLLNGLTNADGIPELQRRLNSLPGDLEEYFQHILDTIDPFYKDRTLSALQLAVETSKPQPFMIYSFLNQTNANFAMDKTFSWPSSEPYALVRQLDHTRRHLDAHCKGLLEITLSDDAPPCLCCHATVDFLHRTVKDFLTSDSMPITSKLREHTSFDPSMFLCKALVARLRLLSLGITRYHVLSIQKEVLKELTFRAQTVETRTKCMSNELVALLDEARDLSRSIIAEGRSFDDLCISYDL